MKRTERFDFYTTPPQLRIQRFLASEDTVRRGIMRCAGDSQAHHYAHRELPEREELFCFASGAKLYRRGTHLWVILGYDPTGADVDRAVKQFTNAIKEHNHDPR